MHDLVNGSMHFFKVVKRRERVLPMCTYFFASFFQKDQQVSIHLRTDEKLLLSLFSQFTATK